MARRRPPPDTRPDWRDPNMPVLAFSSIKQQLVSIEPERLSKVCRWRIENDSSEPDWRHDPTYHLRRKPK